MKPAVTTALTLLAHAACTSESRAPSAAPWAPPGGTATSSEGTSAAGAAMQRETGAGGEPDGEAPILVLGGAGGATADSTGEFVIVDVAAGPCVEADMAPRTLLAADAAGITFDRAGRVADRYFAFDSASLAFVTFAADAATPADAPLASAPVYADLVALAGDSSALRALEIDDAGKLVASRFDAWAARAGTSFELDGANTTHHALLSTGGSALAVWNVGGELRGRLLGADSPEWEPFDFGAASCGDHGCQPVLLQAPGRFVLSWGRVQHDGTFGISLSVIDPSGTVLSTKPVFSSFATYRLVDAVLLADESIVLLIAEGFPAHGVLLARLDPFGNVAEAPQRLLGAVEPWGLASQGVSLAVVARSPEDRAMVRTFSAWNEASENWTCLDDNLAGDPFAPRAAIFATDEGYGLVVRRMDGSSTYAALGAENAP